ncbi:MAG: AbrB/MazE/SpoVT family DNA-binding domain-containing protein [Chloroflexi bacterium]|nr:AbrB/MazE/SpoVT family DNA-binding domain-containing protein [Chloroflexota bacterium]
MQTKIQRWGNSLGLRIPKSFAAEARVEAGSTVDISVEDGGLVVRAVSPRKYELDALLKGIASSNLHDATDWGEPVGREAW